MKAPLQYPPQIKTSQKITRGIVEKWKQKIAQASDVYNDILLCAVVSLSKSV